MFVPIRENGSRPTATNLKKLPLRSANIFGGGVPFARDPKKRNMSQSQIAQLLGTLFNPLCDLDCPPFYKIFFDVTARLELDAPCLSRVIDLTNKQVRNIIFKM